MVLAVKGWPAKLFENGCGPKGGVLLARTWKGARDGFFSGKAPEDPGWNTPWQNARSVFGMKVKAAVALDGVVHDSWNGVLSYLKQ